MSKITIDLEFGFTAEYEVDQCLWDEVLIHYIRLRQADNSIGECFKIINDNLHKRSSKLVVTSRVIDRLTEINKLYAYINDISGSNALKLLKTIDSDAASDEFMGFMRQNAFKKCNIIQFLNDFYSADFINSDLTADVWTKMRPISDEGKARGYSGPSEMPLLLFAGGYKASKGDILVQNKLIEIKGEGGRIGEASKWSVDREKIEKFINQYNSQEDTLREVQIEFDFDGINSQFVTKFDYTMLPHSISSIAKQFNMREMLKTKADAVTFIGVAQLIEYIASRTDEWFILFKHPGKPTVPFGTAFIIDNQKIELSYKCMKKMYNSLKANQINFAPCYDNSGYKIKFMK